MRRLTYALEFVRKPSAKAGSPAKPIVASSARITTTITREGVDADIETLGKFETATLEVKPVPLTHPGGTFTESGTLTFGDPLTSKDRLSFSSVGVGYKGVYECYDARFTPGVVSWVIDGGEGFFKDARGIITSNFLVDESKPKVNGELIAYHFGVVYLP